MFDMDKKYKEKTLFKKKVKSKFILNQFGVAFWKPMNK